MRLRTRAGVAALLAVQLLASCGDPTGAAQLSARYVLLSVDGAALPFTSRDQTTTSGQRRFRLELADTIRLLSETDFRRSFAQYEEFPPYEPLTSVYSRTGTYSLDGDRLTLDGSVVSETFIVARDTLRIQRIVGPYCVEPAEQCTGSERTADFLYAAR